MRSKTPILILSLLAVLHSCLWLWANSGDTGLRDGPLARWGFTAPERLHQAARLLVVAGDERTRAEAIGLHKRLLVLNAASPYEWVGAAFALRAGGEERAGRYAVDRARQLGRAVAPVQMEAAHYYVAAGDLEAVLQTGRRVLELVRNYDGFLFRYYAQMGAATADILKRGVPPTAEATQSFLAYAMETGNVGQATETWRRMTELGFRSPETLGAYAWFLIGEKQPFEAWEAWRQFYKASRPAGEFASGVFNGGFESVPVPGPFDWHWTEVPGAQTAISPEQPKEGASALQISFSGEQNVAYSHLSQMVVAGPGRYELAAWVKADGITTNQGVAVELVTDKGAVAGAFDPVTGSLEWTRLARVFTLSDRRLLTLRVTRQPSTKFDNKIAGVFRLDSVSLKRLD